MEYDIKIEVTFMDAVKSARNKDFTAGWYGCPMGINGAYFDCRIDMRKLKIVLGGKYFLFVKFLNSENVMSLIKKGDEISLWEGGVIAHGKIVEIFK